MSVHKVWFITCPEIYIMTSQLRVNVEIINEYYNLIMIFVTIIVLLLCLRTMKRVYRALRVRSSIIAERVVNIRGLGSYLMYFEGASRRHMNSIVHTRQVKPPTEMNSLQLLAKISRTTLSKRADSSVEVEIRLLNKVRCRVIVIANFRTAHFRRLAFDVRESPFRSKITDDIASTQLKIENALNTMHTEGQVLRIAI